MIAIIGGGAIGGYLAAMLSDAGQKVTLCVRTQIETLTLEASTTLRTVPVDIATDPTEVGPADWVILATKVQDAHAAKPWLDHLVVESKTTLIVAQNGIDHVRRIGLVANGARILPSVVYIAVERTPPCLAASRPTGLQAARPGRTAISVVARSGLFQHNQALCVRT